MTVELKPETEKPVQEEIRRGHFHSVDEVIVRGVDALREKSKMAKATVSPRRSNKTSTTSSPSLSLPVLN